MTVNALSADITPGNIHESARIEGQTIISGERTRIGAGAVVRDSYIHNAIIEPGAQVIDSLIIDGDVGWTETVRSDFEAKWVACFRQVTKIGSGASVTGSILSNCDIGANSRITRMCSWNTLVGRGCAINDGMIDGSALGDSVIVKGPMEIGGSWVGHHAHFDRLGCHNGIYSNDFYVVEFDDKAGQLNVKEILDLPHVSRYGLNTICSLNSGFLPPQPGNAFTTFGTPGTGPGRYGAMILHMGRNRFDPCCWVGGRTKVVGVVSQTVFRSYEDLLTKNNSTHLLPFTVAGKDSVSVFGRSMPGELFDGDLYKRRSPAWAFMYAPEAVCGMVRRIHAVCGKEIADRIPTLTLTNALHFINYTARTKGIDLTSVAPGAKGWAGWLAQSRATVQRLLDSGMWEFSDGEPVAWRTVAGRMTPRIPEDLLSIAPDALEKQCREEDLLACEYEAIARQLGPDEEEMKPTLRESSISPESRVHPSAHIGPGVQILGKSIVEEGAWLYRTIVKDSIVRKNVKALRSCIINSEVENVPELNTCGVYDSLLRSQSGCKGGRVRNSTIPEGGSLNVFSCISDSIAEKGASFGGVGEHITARSSFLLVHPQGYARHVEAVPSEIEIDGKITELCGPAMIGGGGRVFGTEEKPARLECCFMGSNSIIKEGVYVGLGCFVLDGLDAGEGLLPFTLSNGPGPSQDQLSAVLFQHASMVISSIICPMYHGADPADRPIVGQVITAKIKESIRAIEWMLALRGQGKSWDDTSPFAKYANLRHYSANQLTTGLRGFTTALADGRWEVAFVDNELRFTGKGRWVVEDGNAKWRAE